MRFRTNNSEESIKLRRSQNTLVIVGSGIMLTGVWAAIKAYSMLFLRGSKGIESMSRAIDETSARMADREVVIIAVAGVTMYVLFELGLRFYIGRCAIAEGKGRGVRRLYIFITVWLCGLTLLFAIGEAYLMITGSNEEHVTRMDSAAAFIIDMTSLIMMVQMIASHSRVRRYYSGHEREAGHAE